MKLSELKALGEKSTQGEWPKDFARSSSGDGDDCMAVGPIVMTDAEAHADQNLITTMRNHWAVLLKVVEAVSHNPCRHTADHKACDTCEALAELERVK